MDELRGPDRLDLVFVRHLFTFTIFTLAGWTCLSGIREYCCSPARELAYPDPNFQKTVRPASGIIADLRTLRNKTVAHIAMFEPVKDDTSLRRAAYFE
ncbi:MAG: hypothetical protein KAW17_03500 [Candidatus Eisenbacteria sp.]|nr:hypothetical protein [Candidatus Eisenbacteria bacterium]